jgi:predicted nucleotidyltransferase
MKNTNTKERVLELMFNFPTKRFYLREISRIVKISPSAVSRALRELETEGMLISVKKVTYEVRANLSNQSFKNMKRVHNLKMIYASGLFEYLIDNFPLGTIVLFGSYSRGEDIEKSDIDLAVINSKEKKLDLEGYEKKLNRKINLEFLNLEKISKELRDSIINGIVLNGYINLK